MRLLYIANARLPTEKAHGYQICKMCEAFAKNGVEVILIHPYRYQPNPTLRNTNIFEFYGLRPIFKVQALSNWEIMQWNRIIPDRFFAPIFFVHAFLWGRYAVSVVRGIEADVYYTRNIEIAYWLVRAGLRTVYEIHAIPKRGQRWLLQQIAYQSALQFVVALTSFIKEQLVLLGIPDEKILVLADGVDLALFENLPDKKSCRRRLGLPLDRLIVGYVGRFRTMDMEKGIPELMRAVGELPRYKGEDPLLVCVGGPMDIVPVYFKLAQRLGVPKKRLKFVDRVPNTEIPFWLRSFDMVAAPFPINEHYAYYMSPLKIFEYMAAQRPILATNLPSLREILHHGKNAWLVEPDSPAELARGIRTLLEEPMLARRLAAQARMDVQAYTWDTRAATILRALDRAG